MPSKISGASRQLAGDRSLALSGSPNFRDAGGYACDGGSLHWNRLFRSGHLALLTEAERQRVADLGLQLVIDLRREDERRSEPTDIPTAFSTITADITPGSQRSAIYADSTQLGGAQAMFDFMCDINREFVESQTPVFAEIVEKLLTSSAERVLVHCSAGKDRTGFLIAMIQLALGVDTSDVEADYLLSAQYYLPEDHLLRVRAKYPVDHLSDEELLPMMTTNLAYLQTALAAIDQHFGGLDAYLREGLGLGDAERRELKGRFVTP